MSCCVAQVANKSVRVQIAPICGLLGACALATRCAPPLDILVWIRHGSSLVGRVIGMAVWGVRLSLGVLVVQ